MTVSQKVSVSLLISVLLFAVFSVIAFTGLFDLIEARFYNPSITKQALQEITTDANLVEGYIKEVQGRFSDLLKEPSVQRSFLPNQSAEDIFERSKATGLLLEATGGLQWIRFIDVGGKRIHYSTLREDILRQDATSLAYKNYGDNPQDPPFDLINIPDKSPPRILGDGNQERLLFCFPFYDSFSVYRGTAVFSLSIRSITERMIREGRLRIGEEVTLIPEPLGFVTGLPRSGKAALTTAIDSSWKEGILGPVPLSSDNGSRFALLSVKTESALLVGRLLDDRLFVFPFAMKLILLASFFITSFLLVFLFFNLQQDTTTIVRERLKRLQLSLLEEYYDKKEAIDWNRWAREMEQRRETIRSELKRGLPRKPRKKLEQDIDNLIDKSWDEIITILGGKTAPQITATFDESKLQELLNRLLSTAGAVPPAGAPQARSTTAAGSTAATAVATPPESRRPAQAAPQTAPQAAQATPQADLQAAQAVPQAAPQAAPQATSQATLQSVPAKPSQATGIQPAKAASVSQPEEATEAEAVEELEEVESVEGLEEAVGTEPSGPMVVTEEAAGTAPSGFVAEAEEAEALEELEEVEAVKELEEAAEAEPAAESAPAEPVPTETASTAPEGPAAVTEEAEAAPSGPVAEAEGAETLEELEEIEAVEELEEIAEAEPAAESAPAEPVPTETASTAPEGPAAVTEEAEAAPSGPVVVTKENEALEELEEVEAVEELEEAAEAELPAATTPAEVEPAETLEDLAEMEDIKQYQRTSNIRIVFGEDDIPTIIETSGLELVDSDEASVLAILEHKNANTLEELEALPEGYEPIEEISELEEAPSPEEVELQSTEKTGSKPVDMETLIDQIAREIEFSPFPETAEASETALPDINFEIVSPFETLLSQLREPSGTEEEGETESMEELETLPEEGISQSEQEVSQDEVQELESIRPSPTQIIMYTPFSNGAKTEPSVLEEVRDGTEEEAPEAEELINIEDEERVIVEDKNGLLYIASTVYQEAQKKKNDLNPDLQHLVDSVLSAPKS
ncbi:hypothetical protein [Gracilinema caldarium]|uniref:hypothetical protein n=1 Tax=Gracilinema caldarium TaxID=215591 RepID=UPI0026F29F94|nr:hypothetical protein [Gracilinema caldarium]